MSNFGACKRMAAAALLAAAVPALSACTSQVQTHGYLLSQSALEQVKVGSSQEQVLVVLGTPSTTATLQGEVYYYISTKTKQTVAFMKPSVVDQSVLAVYFNKNRKVERIANYGLKDGVVFDFIGRSTPTSGQEITFLSRVLKVISF